MFLGGPLPHWRLGIAAESLITINFGAYNIDRETKRQRSILSFASKKASAAETNQTPPKKTEVPEQTKAADVSEQKKTEVVGQSGKADVEQTTPLSKHQKPQETPPKEPVNKGPTAPSQTKEETGKKGAVLLR